MSQQFSGIYYDPTRINNANYKNITQIHFCPVCNNVLKFQENYNGSNVTGEYYWICPVCNYKEKFTVNKISISNVNQYKPIDYSLYKYDQSLKRCHNFCPNCKKVTELCIFYYENNSMKNGYVCVQCNNFFKNEE